MAKNSTNNYREVKLDTNGRGYGKFYLNPLAETFQYEYALFMAVSGLFESVRCRSKCVESLKLYYMELTQRKEKKEESQREHKTRESVLEEMEKLVETQVVGKVTFPMMHICAAEVKTVTEEDRTHSFIFTDGIYGFRVHIRKPAKGMPMSLEVVDLTPKATDEAETESGSESEKGSSTESGTEAENAALNSAA